MKLNKESKAIIELMIADGIITQEIAEKYCPELRENKNERIRKALKSYFDSEISYYGNIEWRHGIKYGEVIAWLEEQIEQKSSKVKPKFKDGDWVVSPNGVYWHVDAIRDGRYQVSSNSGICTDWPLDTNIYHKFTIQDAKEGDILVCEYDLPFIYNGWLKENKCPFGYCGILRDYSGDNFHVSGEKLPWTSSNVYPANKEQCDLLFQKMKEAGYMWDAERLELLELKEEQSVEWTEEDEENRLIVNKAILEYNMITQEQSKELVDWMKTFKYRRFNLTEKEKKLIQELCDSLDRSNVPSLKHPVEDYIKFLKTFI